MRPRPSGPGPRAPALGRRASGVASSTCSPSNRNWHCWDGFDVRLRYASGVPARGAVDRPARGTAGAGNPVATPPDLASNGPGACDTHRSMARTAMALLGPIRSGKTSVPERLAEDLTKTSAPVASSIGVAHSEQRSATQPTASTSTSARGAPGWRRAQRLRMVRSSSRMAGTLPAIRSLQTGSEPPTRGRGPSVVCRAGHLRPDPHPRKPV